MDLLIHAKTSHEPEFVHLNFYVTLAVHGIFTIMSYIYIFAKMPFMSSGQRGLIFYLNF